ncbi:hypothetical protein Leryth_017971 [Lithospermum erythrorhizon]|nr:hypothetical protein Leryth_017971 [Lithospermum erythrorhizon]
MADQVDSSEPLLKPYDGAEQPNRRIQTMFKVMEEVKQLLAIAFPIILTGLLVYGKSMISTMYMGRLGCDSLAGGSISIAITNITGYSVIYGLATGVEAISSQALWSKAVAFNKSYTPMDYIDLVDHRNSSFTFLAICKASTHTLRSRSNCGDFCFDSSQSVHSKPVAGMFHPPIEDLHENSTQDYPSYAQRRDLSSFAYSNQLSSAVQIQAWYQRHCTCCWDH